MKNIIKIIITASLAMILLISFGVAGFAQSVPQVTTNPATNISNSSAALNGTLSGMNSYSSNYVYFQWGTTTGYGNETLSQSSGNSGMFTQVIYNLSYGTTYHFRAVAQGGSGTVYGQDMIFTTTGTGSGYGSLSATKRAVNLSSGNLAWSSSISASPSDVLVLGISLQATGQDVHNVIVRDFLPANLIFKNSLVVNNVAYSGDITSGINIGTIFAGQLVTITYQVQVAGPESFIYGTTTITNNATVTSNETGSQTATEIITVNRSSVYGASTVSTGLTNNLLADSFFIPLLIIIMGLWIYFSGNAYKFADWLKTRI